MPNNYFKFKQFTVWQNHSAMRVGTDGVLLGAWADCSNCKRTLDIGTGTGLISLMIAQRSDTAIDAVEINTAACIDAETNFTDSAWHNRLFLHHKSLEDFSKNCTFTYDLIVSNPPYFENSLQNPDHNKATARHTESLSYEELLRTSSELLNTNGRICIVVPANSKEKLEEIGEKHHLKINKAVYIHTTPKKQAKRVLLQLSSSDDLYSEENLIIEEFGRHQYSKEYLNLTKDYYLFA